MSEDQLPMICLNEQMVKIPDKSWLCSFSKLAIRYGFSMEALNVCSTNVKKKSSMKEY